MPQPIETLTQRILEHPAPVVFLDTCALLDVIRSSHRHEIDTDVARAALALSVAASANPAHTWIVVAELVLAEWTEHVATAEVESNRRISDLSRGLAVIRSLAEHFPVGPVPYVDLERLQLPKQLRSVAATLVDMSQVMAEDAALLPSAWHRVANAIPPAAKGKQEFKDCLILEHYLSLAKRLRDQGFTPPTVFVSSNTRDYGSPGQIDPRLQADFAAVTVSLVTNLAWALAIINDRAPGIGKGNQVAARAVSLGEQPALPRARRPT